jgi:hypothetical protein
MHGILWLLMLLVLTDVGYVAYWNSLYTEPTSCLSFLFLLAESISMCKTDEASLGSIVRWHVFATLLITAKAQNAALGLPLGAYGLGMFWRALDRKARYAASAGVLLTGLAAVTMYATVRATTKMTALYNVIFFGILPESGDPGADLKALGLDPNYAQYSGTVAWSAGTGVGDGTLVNAIQAHVNSFKLVAFYLSRPVRIWQRLEELLPISLSLRPEFCGNFDRSAGRRPGANSEAIALWSRFHERGLSRIAPLLLGELIVVVICGGLLLFLSDCSAAVRRWRELGICLATCCLTAFFVALFGDAWDTVKHQFLFNLLLDTCLVFGFVVALQSTVRILRS